MKATRKQLEYARELARKAGYINDPGYDAADELLGDGRHWKDDAARVSKLITLLQAKLGISPSQKAKEKEAYGSCRDCGAPGILDARKFGINCGCAAEF